MLENGKPANLEGLINGGGGLLLPHIDSETCEPGTGDGYRTETCPTNSAIATGLGYPGMANWTNADPHPIPDGLTLWEWFKERGYATGMVCSKEKPYWPHTPLSNAEPDIDYLRVGGLSSWVTQKSVEYVRQYSSLRFFLWAHYSEADDAGHYYGENSVEYSEALARQDQELGTLLTELASQGLEAETLVVLTTDHGFVEGGFGDSVCDGDTKDLFLAASPQVPGFSSCVEAQTDIAPCIKGVVSEHG
jgi:arylsulfatase A-like enzyme